MLKGRKKRQSKKADTIEMCGKCMHAMEHHTRSSHDDERLECMIAGCRCVLSESNSKLGKPSGERICNCGHKARHHDADDDGNYVGGCGNCICEQFTLKGLPQKGIVVKRVKLVPADDVVRIPGMKHDDAVAVAKNLVDFITDDVGLCVHNEFSNSVTFINRDGASDDD